MADDTEIEQMLDEKIEENGKKKEKGKDKEKDREKKHKKHKHQKSHKSDRKHDRRKSRTRSRSPIRLANGKRTNVNSALHQLAESLAKNRSAEKNSRREKSPDLTNEERDFRTIFCMQLAAAIRPRDLENFFSRVGKVRDVRLITDPRTHRSKGVAYVEFRDLSSVQSALALSGEKVLGIPIIIKPSNAEKNRMATQQAAASAAQISILNNGLGAISNSIIPSYGPMKLYVGSLHFNINEEMLRAIFEPFGRIENITLMRDADTGRSRGYGFIGFAQAEDAKRAMDSLNGFELAGRPMKVGHVTEKTSTELNVGTGGNYNVASTYSSAANLDSDELDNRGINLGPTGRLALMAKLSEGSGLQMPKHAMDALQAVHMQAAGSQHVRTAEPPNSQQLATVTAVTTQCFMLSNMFDPVEEARRNPNWPEEIRDEVIEECNRFGGIVHIYVDEKSSDGNVYVKCPTIASAINAVNSLHGRFFSGRQLVGNYIPIQSYLKLFPAASGATVLLKISSEKR